MLFTQIRAEYVRGLQEVEMTSSNVPLADVVNAADGKDDWDQHWRDYTDSAEQNPAQLYRQQIACTLMREHGCSSTSKVLDVGSGQGDFARVLSKAFPGAKLAGLELSATGVELASRKVPGGLFQQRDLLAPNGDPGLLSDWAQYATCCEVLEHLDDPILFLKNTAAYLAPGCMLVVTVPGGPMSAFDRHIGHRAHFTPARLSSVLEQSGFQVEQATTAGFPFFNLYRMTVILRGRRLISDVQSNAQGPASWLASALMAAFRPLFLLNLRSSGLGWQTVAVARWVGSAR
jgi:SAM-dependent methyltransferase